jgi:coenzyme F420-reducing hydrogenase delta subunit
LLSSALCVAAVDPSWAAEAFVAGCAAGVCAGVVLEVCEKEHVAQKVTSSTRSFFMIPTLTRIRLPDERNGHHLGNTPTAASVKSQCKIAVKKDLETKAAE